MSRCAIVAVLVLAAGPAASGQRAPVLRLPGGRSVEYLLRSPDLPTAEVRVAPQLTYLGVLRYDVPSGATAEEFIFGDTAGGKLQRAFIAHFEGYRPGINHTFQYPRLEMTRLGAHEYLHQTWALAQFSLFELPEMRAVLARRGLSAERSWLVDRYVRVVDTAAKHEVIFFYMEAAAIQGPGIVYGGAPVAPPPPPAPPAAVNAAVRARAAAAFQVHDQ